MSLAVERPSSVVSCEQRTDWNRGKASSSERPPGRCSALVSILGMLPQLRAVTR